MKKKPNITRARVHPDTKEDIAIDRFLKYRILGIDDKIRYWEAFLIKNCSAPSDFLKNDAQHKEYVHARYVFFYIISVKEKLINQHKLGMRFLYDHSTITHAKNQVNKYLEMKKKYPKKIVNENFEPYNCVLL